MPFHKKTLKAVKKLDLRTWRHKESIKRDVRREKRKKSSEARKRKSVRKSQKHPQKSFGRLSKSYLGMRGESPRKEIERGLGIKRLITHDLRKKSRKTAKAIMRGVSLLKGN
jgi:hypothetical protein